MIKIFCFFSGIEYDNSLLDILQIARFSFRKKGFLVFKCLLWMMKLEH